MSLAMLIPLPVLLPLIGAGITLMLAGRARAQAAITIITLLAVLAIDVVLLIGVDARATQALAVGGWELPFGIALVVDRVSALMLVISAIVTFGVLLYACLLYTSPSPRD